MSSIVLKVFTGIASLFLLALVFFNSQAPLRSNESDVCNKEDKNSFQTCINTRFPVGSDLSDLRRFLIEEGFLEVEELDDMNRKRFYFLWSTDDLSNYKIGVVGYYDSDCRIIAISVI